MPVSTLSGVLTREAKAALAEELTAFHCACSGVPRNRVHVIFHEYTPGNGYTAGKAAAAAALTLLIRTSRSEGVQGGFIKRLWKLLQGATGSPGHRNSRRSAQSGHGEGANHARGRDASAGNTRSFPRPSGR